MPRPRHIVGSAALVGVRALAVALAAALLAGLPLVIGVEGDRLSVSLVRPLEAFGSYLGGLADGSSLRFATGYRTRSLLEDGPRMLLTSMSYAVIPAVIAVLVGIPLGSLLGYSRRDWVRDVVAGFGFIPDFMVVLGLQLGVVWVTRHTGHRLASVATLTRDEPAVLLPLLAMTLVPTAYLSRMVSVRVQDLVPEDFVRLARSRGLPAWRVRWCHIMPNALVAVRSNAHKLAAVLLTELFIVEYLFNLPGMTALVLARGLDGGYQYPLVLNAFLSLAVTYYVVYRVVRGLIALVDGAVRRA